MRPLLRFIAVLSLSACLFAFGATSSFTSNIVFAQATQQAGEAAEQVLGLSRDQRRNIQRALNDLGYNAGTPDGIFGKVTRRAISGYQAGTGQRQTGFLDDVMLAALLKHASSVLKRGEASTSVSSSHNAGSGINSLRFTLDCYLTYPAGTINNQITMHLDEYRYYIDHLDWNEFHLVDEDKIYLEKYVSGDREKESYIDRNNGDYIEYVDDPETGGYLAVGRCSKTKYVEPGSSEKLF